MNYRIFLMIALALSVMVGVSACAENPADNVPAAEVSDSDAGSMAEESGDMADESEDMTDEDGDAAEDESEGMTDEDGDAAEDEAGDEAAAGDDESDAMAGEAVELTGTIGVTGSKVTGSHYLLFEDWTGMVDLGDGMPENVMLMFEVDMASLVTDPDNQGPMTGRLDGHLRGEDFFAIDQFPNATFVSTSIVEGGGDGATHTITGDFTLRGVTKEIAFPATVDVTDDMVAATAEFALNRLDFGMAFPGQPDDLIREEVVMQIDVEGSL